MNSNHILTGRIGEDIAAKHYEDQGYKVVHRNWRYKRCEIDLIVCKDKEYVFVEVKTRKSNRYGFPELFVSLSKQSRMAQAAEFYIQSLGPGYVIRFDIVAIILNQKTPEVLQVERAFNDPVRNWIIA